MLWSKSYLWPTCTDIYVKYLHLYGNVDRLAEVYFETVDIALLGHIYGTFLYIFIYISNGPHWLLIMICWVEVLSLSCKYRIAIIFLAIILTVLFVVK